MNVISEYIVILWCLPVLAFIIMPLALLAIRTGIRGVMAGVRMLSISQADQPSKGYV